MYMNSAFIISNKFNPVIYGFDTVLGGICSRNTDSLIEGLDWINVLCAKFQSSLLKLFVERKKKWVGFLTICIFLSF